MKETHNTLTQKSFPLLLNHIDSLRDKTLIQLITKTGLSVTQLCQLSPKHLNQTNTILTLSGKHPRTISLDKDIQNSLTTWLTKRPPSAYLFPSQKNPKTPLSARGIDNILRKWGEKSEIFVNYRILKQLHSETKLKKTTTKNTLFSSKHLPKRKIGTLLLLGLGLWSLLSKRTQTH